jgi:hypothetical protein
MKATNLFVVLVLILAAASFALWGCGKSSSSSGGGGAPADDDSGGSVSDACNAYVAKCGGTSLGALFCSYWQEAAIVPCISTVALNFFKCLDAISCTDTTGAQNCATQADLVLKACA